MTDERRRLRILFACPAYWPALAFGGPVWMARELNEGMVELGHEVEVVTTSLVDLDRPPSRRTTTRTVEGVVVHYLATPLRYRWMGVTPSLPLVLRRLERPDVVHVFGFRDPLGTLISAWAAWNDIPYVFEPLGMYRPKLRKVTLKRFFDVAVARHVARHAAAVVATSEFERAELLARGVPPERVDVRGNGFPPPLDRAGNGRLRRALELPPDARIVLYVGRVAKGKGIDLLVQALRALPDVHLALVGPDGADGTLDAVRAAAAEPALQGRIHHLPPSGSDRPLSLYAEADVFALPSEGESFGMVAAEAAAAGTPVVLTDRCGVADVLGGRGALVIPYDAAALEQALATVLADTALARRLGEGGRAVAAELSWATIVRRQEQIYFRVAG